MIRKLRSHLVILALGAAAPALGQDTLLGCVVDACKGDLEQYRSQVTLGEACKKAIADTVS